MIVGVVPVRGADSVSTAWRVLDMPLVDAVELRLDYLGSVDDMLIVIREAGEAGLLEKSIVTVRAWWEGGSTRVSDEERIGVLKAALDHGAMLVDLEVLTFERVERNKLKDLDWGRVLLSLHAPLERFSEGLAEYLLARASSLGAWGAKLAIGSEKPSNRLASVLYWFLGEARRRGLRAAAMPYGCCKGLRLALYAAGSEILYVCARRDAGSTAEGQPCLEDDGDRSLVEAASRLRALVVRELEG